MTLDTGLPPRSRCVRSFSSLPTAPSWKPPNSTSRPGLGGIEVSLVITVTTTDVAVQPDDYRRFTMTELSARPPIHRMIGGPPVLLTSAANEVAVSTAGIDVNITN